MKSILSICAFLIVFNLKGFSQESVNSYKYVIVPTSYNFLNSPDQYQINSLTKFLFEKYGFTTLMADAEFPEDLTTNRCLGLFADVEKQKAFLNTKLQVHLKDCNNKLVLSSDVGESREKEYDKVYNLALRDAFKSFENLNYQYQPNPKIESTTTSKAVESVDAQIEIERLKQEVELLKEKDIRSMEKVEPAPLGKEKDIRNGETLKNTPVVNTVEKAVPIVVVGAEAVKTEGSKSNDSNQTLSANPVENGYTITDASSKVLYHLVFSGKEDVYIVKGQDAIVYKMNNAWIVSTASDSGVSMKTLKVKFN